MTPKSKHQTCKLLVRVILTTYEPEGVTEVDPTAQVPGVCSLYSKFFYSNMGQQQTTDSDITLETKT